MKGVIFNQDDSEFFGVHPPEQVSGEAVDAWVDGLAEAGVGTLVSCVCAMTTNYASKAWEPRWARYDPDGPDDQPVLRHLPKGRVAPMRRWLASVRKLADLGVNFHERAFARCRKHGIGAWASIRMNDVHDCTLEDSPLLSTFYRDQRRRKLLRVEPRPRSWQDRALDWGRDDVREHYMKLVDELLATLDLDGLELDWMRFGFHFQPGKERAGGKLLTTWIRRVQAKCRQAAKRLGHPVLLGCRVPSRPDTARKLGMDGVAWAKEGLIDLLVPTPFWATCELNMPIARWRKLLGGTKTTLAGGLEVRYQPVRGGPARMMTPELAAGAAMAVLHGGADAVYLFNYFAKGHALGKQWTMPKYNAVLRAMRSIESLDKLPRRHALTYRDVLAPGERPDDPLPAVGRTCTFRIQTGPKPAASRKVELLLEFAKAPSAPPRVRVNDTECPEPLKPRGQVVVYSIPAAALADGAQRVETEAGGKEPAKIMRAELAIGGSD